MDSEVFRLQVEVRILWGCVNACLHTAIGLIPHPVLRPKNSPSVLGGTDNPKGVSSGPLGTGVSDLM